MGVVTTRNIAQLKKEVSRLAQDNAEQKASLAQLMEENRSLRGRLEAATTPAEQVRPTAEDVLEAAQDEYVAGHYAAAITQARTQLSAEPDKAWRLIGASSCFLKDRKAATNAFSHLDAEGKQFVVYVCSRNGVQLK